MAQDTALVATFAVNYDVRIIRIGEEFWFVAVDVAKVLGIEKIRNTLAHFPEDEKKMINLKSTVCNTYGTTAHSMGGSSVYNVHGKGGNPNVLCVNEAGLYRLIFQSHKPEAEKFKRWVFHEVLPSIRKTGSYSVGDSENDADNTESTPEIIPFVEGIPLLRQITADHPEWSWDLKEVKFRVDENGIIRPVLCFNMKIDE